jgi:hypothetical protein
MSVAHSGKSRQKRFTKTGFAAAGPEHGLRVQDTGAAIRAAANQLSLLALAARNEPLPCNPISAIPAGPFRKDGLNPPRTRARTGGPSGYAFRRSILPAGGPQQARSAEAAPGLWDPKGCAGPVGCIGCSGARGRRPRFCPRLRQCLLAAKGDRRVAPAAVNLTRWSCFQRQSTRGGWASSLPKMTEAQT